MLTTHFPPERMALADRFSENSRWMASQAMWSAAGQRGEGGPDQVRQDTVSVKLVASSH
jgi:hypothetical protein